MYLTRLLLNPASADAQRDLASPYQLHKTLAKAFPDPESEQHRARHGILFRIEQATSEGAPVLVQSATEPSWDLLPQGYALRVDGPKAFDPTLAEGQHLSFRFVANPTVRKTPPGKKNGRRVPLSHRVRQHDGDRTYFDWLGDQAERCGFAVLDVRDAPFRLAPRRRKKDSERQNYEKSRIPHFGVRFDGVLTVTDPEVLKKAVRQGIGPAKAFGFGLLSLAPA